MHENPEYLTTQLITYIGNKRTLLPFIGDAVGKVRARLGGGNGTPRKLAAFDAFSGSGVVSRFLKQHCAFLASNDLETYAAVINRCYLANRSELDIAALQNLHQSLVGRLEREPLVTGIIARHYAPEDDRAIKAGERAFYTGRNARFLDTARRLIGELPASVQDFFLAPLLAEASIHANTSGVFKGFHKDPKTGIGQFGGSGRDALPRITSDIVLPFPVLSNFECETRVIQADACVAARQIPPVDLAYLDPPYNQHPYGSNYFMLNLLADYLEPESPSRVSGIPAAWRRSAYNRRAEAASQLEALIESINAPFILVSFNSEGFIDRESMISLLGRFGAVEAFETRYNAFRGSRNLMDRSKHVSEYLFLVERKA